MAAEFPLIRRGDSGVAVTDVQRRLADAGFPVDQDPAGSFADGTYLALRAFQQSRHLPADGVVGPDTWAALIEAAWRLGDRPLYERRPHLRGDDVASLQERLARLGFDVGKVDGILGPQARAAILEFQRNTGLAADGIAGPATVRALDRVEGAPAGVADVALRERGRLRQDAVGLAGRRVFLDPRGGAGNTGVVGPGGVCEADAALDLAAEVSRALRSADALVLLSRDSAGDPTSSERAGLANWFGADAVVGLGFAVDPGDASVIAVSYFGTARFRSAAGQRLARLIGAECAELGGAAVVHPVPSAAALLRETRAPAVLIELPFGPDGSATPLLRPTAAAVTRALRDFL